MSEQAQAPTLLASAEEVLRDRAASLAREAEQSAEVDLLSLLLFRVADEWYAVPLSDVREIMQDFSITPIPCVPDFIQGVTNVRGEILSVTEAARLMRVSGPAPSAVAAAPAVVIAAEGVATALIVDEIGDIAEVAEHDVEPPVSAADRIRSEFVSASIEIEGRVVALANTERILAPVVTAGRH